MANGSCTALSGSSADLAASALTHAVQKVHYFLAAFINRVLMPYSQALAMLRADP